MRWVFQNFYNHGQKFIAKRQTFRENIISLRKVLNLGLKAEKPLQNENRTEDWH